jgi:glycosyltransferase involved in cell wall biosynthesis
MRIVIDYQGAQSPANGKRGIGRYTSSLVQAMVRRAEDHEIVLVLNGLFADSVEDAMTSFGGLVARRNIHVWYPPPHRDKASPGSQRAKEKLYEAYLASLQPDVVFVTSLFEGLGDASVTSVGAFRSLATAVTLYDLIPLINPKPYLDNPAVRGWYMRKISALRRADMWFAISESSRQEGIDHLGLDPARCINVSTAAYDHFRPMEIAPVREQALRNHFGLHKPFVMYTGGIDHRKNLEGLIRAYALLPAPLRGAHQLAIVCAARSEDRSALLELARSKGLAEGDVVVTGFVPEQDLVELYNLCALFVFPSWHEGFGLPALEAMHCGAVVIGANTSSLPEVIGCAEALFDPRDDGAIAAKMAQALTDDTFRKRLADHGLRQAQAFSWDESARRALAGLEQLHESAPQNHAPPAAAFQGLRPRLAYVSPLSPERSGIASYSAELLPELALHYDIELITDLKTIDDPVLSASFPIRSVASFRENAGRFDRVLYHFGNSEFHQHMFSLLGEIPGTVVLHDFYLSGVQARREFHGGNTFGWTQALYESHGYPAVAERFKADVADVMFKYPCNFEVLAQAEGVIVHSPYAIKLAREWFGDAIARDWALVPHLRVPPADPSGERAVARKALGLKPEEFLVSAFGMLGPTKLNHRLLDAWLASPLSDDPRCRLVFVGDNDSTSYGRELERRIRKEARTGKVSITGWASAEDFQRYLAATDIAVQLRTQSRGETSGTVLDAMSRGVPTIVNANGSMASLPSDSVLMLSDEFRDAELAEAMERLWRAPELRATLGANGRLSILSKHAPALCARRYADAIENFAGRAAIGCNGLLRSIDEGDPLSCVAELDSELLDLSQAIADALPAPLPQAQLFVDVSELVQRDSKSGIQRVVKSLLRVLLDDPPPGYRIEPVYAIDSSLGYRYARKFTLEFMGCPDGALDDARIDMRPGDVFVGLDLQPHLIPRQRDFYRRLRRSGVRVEFVVYDLLPILLTHRFSEDAAGVHARWLKVVAESDGAICISQAVAEELLTWLAEHAPERLAEGFKVRSFHLGADLGSSVRSTGLPTDAESILRTLSASPTFLMVGTVEPRKGHALALEAFEALWSAGQRVNLVIAGKQGWMVHALGHRLRQHHEQGKRLFWLDAVSDEYLEKLYASASCLIAASEGEGFGLPLIEGAMHGLPILATDLPVFREVAGAHASYFEGKANSLAAAIREWLELFERQEHPRSDAMPYLTWRESADAFKAALLDGASPPTHLPITQNTPYPPATHRSSHAESTRNLERSP